MSSAVGNTLDTLSKLTEGEQDPMQPEDYEEDEEESEEDDDDGTSAYRDGKSSGAVNDANTSTFVAAGAAPPALLFPQRFISLFSENSRPLSFFAFVSLAGPVKSLFRYVAIYVDINSPGAKSTTKDTSGLASKTNNGGGSSTIFSYPETPLWMRQARAEIPKPVVAIATTILNGLGIPTYFQVREMQYRKSLQQLEELTNGGTSFSGDDASSSSKGNDSSDAGGSSATGNVFFVPLPLAFMLSGLAICLTSKFVLATRCQAIRQRQRQQEILGEDSRGLDDIMLFADAGVAPVQHHQTHERSPGIDENDEHNPEEHHAPHTPRPGSAGSSEPTHGQRARDASRTTPRTAFMRAQERAVAVSGALAQSSSSGLGGAASPPVFSNLQINHSIGGLSPLPHEPSGPHPPRSSLSGQDGPQHRSGEAILAFAAPAPLAVVQSLIGVAGKNRCRRVIICRTGEDFSSLNIPADLHVDVVDDLRSFVKSLRLQAVLERSTNSSTADLDGGQPYMSVAVLDHKTSSSFDLFPFYHPPNVVYVVSPPHTIVDTAWCDFHLHVSNEKSSSTFVALLSVVLFDRARKEQRKAADSQSQSQSQHQAQR